MMVILQCSSVFTIGDLNVHFDKPSDPTTSALNVVLDNLSLHTWARHSCDRRLHSCHCLCCVLVFSVVLDFSDFARMTVRNL